FGARGLSCPAASAGALSVSLHTSSVLSCQWIQQMLYVQVYSIPARLHKNENPLLHRIFASCRQSNG
ncbi:hypothetical protein SD70_30585, partial [Gordoniibacillus kamchatkensis]